MAIEATEKGLIDSLINPVSKWDILIAVTIDLHRRYEEENVAPCIRSCNDAGELQEEKSLNTSTCW